LDALDLWEAVEEDYEVHPLPNNPTVAQIKNHKREKNKEIKSKSLSICCCFHNNLHQDYVT